MARTKGAPVPARLKLCDLSACEAMCCHDGAWLSPREEERLTRLMAETPGPFAHIDGEPFAEAWWKGKPMGRKTAARPHTYRPGLLPPHFPSTRCVFALEDGRCSIQVAAVARGEAPWTWKPSACWMHPLRLTAQGVTPPPQDHRHDPDRDGERYPGFVTFTGCGAHHDDGADWRQVLSAELAWFERGPDEPPDEP